VLARVVLVVVVILGLCLFVYRVFKCDGDRLFVCGLFDVSVSQPLQHRLI